jgi:hypothetical protein
MIDTIFIAPVKLCRGEFFYGSFQFISNMYCVNALTRLCLQSRGRECLRQTCFAVKRYSHA